MFGFGTIGTVSIVFGVVAIFAYFYFGDETDYPRQVINNIWSCIRTKTSIKSEGTISGKMATNDKLWQNAENIYQFSVKDKDGNEVSLEKYSGHVTLIVNVASKWGFTNNNYQQLQALYARYADSHGLRVAAFPCNQFASQEPEPVEKIKDFTQSRFGVQFDIYDKIDVNGDSAHPLFKYLKSKLKGTLTNAIKWNFTKFLIDKKGIPIKRYGPNTEPKSIEKDIKDLF